MLDDAYQAATAEPADDEPEDPSQYERDQPERIGRAPRETPEPATERLRRMPREVQQPVFEDPSGVIPQQADGTYSRLSPEQVAERQMIGRLPEHARQHLAVQQLALSQAEKMNLQRLQNGMGTVDKMLARGQIDQDQADEMKAKILNIKGPLERRAAHAVAQQHEQQTKLIQQQVAQGAAMDALNAKYHKLSAQDRATPVDLGDGRKGVMVQTSPGKWQFHELKDEKADQEEKKQEKITAHLEKREKDWRTVYDHAVKTVDQKIADKREAEAEANLDAKTKGTGVREHSDFNRDKMIADELKARGHEGTIEEHRAAERVKIGLKPKAEVNPATPPPAGDKNETAGGNPVTNWLRGGKQGEGLARPDQKPIQKPEDMTPEQKKAMEGFDQIEQLIERNAIWGPDAKEEMRYKLGNARARLKEYGSTERMPPEDRKRYQDEMNRVRELLERKHGG